ncbi:MAG: hypothetical protein WCI92_13610 [Bacteroidota bacterium]
MRNLKELKNAVLHCFILVLLSTCSISANAQEPDDKTDSLYVSKLMQVNLELYSEIDSLNFLIKECETLTTIQYSEVDSLKVVVAQCQARLTLKGKLADTLEVSRLRLAQELISVREILLKTNSELELKLQLLRDREFQLNDCQIKLREAQSAASLSQAKLEGKMDVSNARVEAKDREIAYMQESQKEKDRIIAEKTADIATLYHEKSNSLRVVDSLARALNSTELELAKVSERLRIIETQYNEMVAQRTAATNKKKKVRFVQGFALKNYRTPDWQLAPESSTSANVYVISNKNAGNIEFDYITGVSLSLYDLSQPDGKYTYDAGLFVGFGGTNLFKNFYIAPSAKAFDYFHFMLGVNIAEYQQLKEGFSEGDPLPPGMNIPTVKEWKANLFFGMTIDFELLSNIPKKM